MKISYNWLKSHIDIPFSIEELKDTLTDIGLEVEAVEPFESIKGGLKGLITGHVIEKEKHPDADKLSVCKVDTDTEILQIVCGAPNVAAGQKVIVATVGSTVYPTNGEAFAIKKAKIRGVESFGMICAEDEIGLGTAHDGILILDKQTEVGKQVAELYNVENDYLFEIGLTPNRTDAFSHIGVARDLAACLTFRTKKAYKLSEAETVNYLENCKNLHNDFSVEIENKAACPYYSGIILTDIQVKESPQWLKNRLLCIGQKPINNVVDITNFILHEYGQPLHAFDLNEIKGNKIIVKNLPEKTKFLALDNSTIELHQEDLMICDGDENGMCIAGVYGGLESGVKNSTTAIFLECAYFDPKTIRRTSMRHTLRTESAIHFEKGIDPNIQEKALNHAIHLLTALANAQPASPVYIAQSEQIRFDGKNYKAPFDVTLALSDIHKLTGAAISKKEAEEIAGLLDIQVKDISTDDSLHLAVAPYRTDVYRPADVIEEILRIYGFNNVPIPTKLNASIQFSKHDFKDKLYNKTADFLVARGFFEMMNNSIVKSKQQAALKNENEENWVRLLSS
ncbi:MAG TPA: phenylalanine--tRNA ligase subunit beta, partial [Chitinophagales bacterium]|nr:phenylalanine--tRNA ligase subunit beta [Chitinophagales bacterium]